MQVPTAGRALVIGPLTALAFVSLSAGCGSELPLGPDADDSSSGSYDVGDIGEDKILSWQELPFRMDASAVLLSQMFAPDFGPPLFGRSTFDGRCSTPSDFVVRFGLAGEATHIGQFTATAEHCTIVDFATGGALEVDGAMVVEVANGDELWDSYEGTSAPGQPFVESHSFAGGTGRFADATGSGSAIGRCNRDTGTCVLLLRGTIGYDASDRASAPRR